MEHGVQDRAAFQERLEFQRVVPVWRGDSINDGTASTAGSNWANNPAGYTLDPTLSRSNYDPGSRVNFTAVAPIPLGHGIRSTVSMFYNGQSGRPYSVQFNGNPNDDNRTNNDIIYVPM